MARAKPELRPEIAPDLRFNPSCCPVSSEIRRPNATPSAICADCFGCADFPFLMQTSSRPVSR
jgi:hypothetical protein